MNIKEFMLDNFIWILVVIILIIITVIGFLVDKKRSGKKDNSQADNNTVGPMPMVDNNMNTLNNGINNNQMLNSQPFVGVSQGNQQMMNNTLSGNSQAMNVNMMNSQPVMPMQETGSNGMGQMSGRVDNVGNNFNMNNSIPQSVENVGTVVNPEPLYQPLSEQVPHFMPNNSTIPVGEQQMVNNMNSVVPPTPVASVPVQNNQPMFVPNTNQMAMNNNFSGNMNNNMNYGSQGNNNGMNQVNSGQANFNQMGNSNVSSGPVSFVYGPQNNNQN